MCGRMAVEGDYDVRVVPGFSFGYKPGEISESLCGSGNGQRSVNKVVLRVYDYEEVVWWSHLFRD